MSGNSFTTSSVYAKVVKVGTWRNSSNGGSISESTWPWSEKWDSMQIKSVPYKILAVSILNCSDLLTLCFAISIFISCMFSAQIHHANRTCWPTWNRLNSTLTSWKSAVRLKLRSRAWEESSSCQRWVLPQPYPTTCGRGLKQRSDTPPYPTKSFRAT